MEKIVLVDYFLHKIGLLMGKNMKKYYCPTCGEFKHRWQLKKVDDTRVAFYECRYCHNSNIYTTEDVMNKLINNTLHEQDFSARHGSWL